MVPRFPRTQHLQFIEQRARELLESSHLARQIHALIPQLALPREDAPWPSTIRGINGLPDDQRNAIYRSLLPVELFDKLGLDPATHTHIDHGAVSLYAPDDSRAMELVVRNDPQDRDPMFYLNIADTFNNQIRVLFVIINDPDSPRFDTDVDEEGRPTHFGTERRNIPAELAAMQAGLMPGQVRRGLSVLRACVPMLEDFVDQMGHDMFLVEPLAYHNAILFERYGFSYLVGRQEMERIHAEFQPGGELHAKLTPDNPFRAPDHWQTVHGRSWAIHDGILGHPYSGVQMYKRIGIDADVSTFPDAIWR